MTTDEAAQQRLREAKARLLETLSGRKQNAAPDSNGNPEPYRTMAAQIKLNAAKKEMVLTLSHGRKSDGYNDGTVVAEYPHEELVKQAALKAELRQRLAGQTRKGQKQNACPFADNSTGKTDVTKDSPITPSGIPFSGGWEITGRGGRVTLASILADEQDKADEESPSPAVVSGQTGTSNWSPDTAQADYTSDQHSDADKAKADLLAHYTSGKTGKISGYAKCIS